MEKNTQEMDGHTLVSKEAIRGAELHKILKKIIIVYCGDYNSKKV